MEEQSSPSVADASVQLTTRKTARQRVSNACVRCRRQKIKCSGAEPCNTCKRRKLTCKFDDQRDKVLVNRDGRLLARLEEEARVAGRQRCQSSGDDPACPTANTVYIPSDLTSTEPHDHAIQDEVQEESQRPPPSSSDVESHDAARLGIDLAPEESREGSDPRHANDSHFTNSLMDVPQSYTTDDAGRQFYLGTSSNWSFGRRVLSMIHERLSDGPLPIEHLLFKGEAYDLDCAGSCDDDSSDNASVALPTADFASFLINGVRFRCGQLFHLFDERSFMEEFTKFHQGTRMVTSHPDLFYVHYTLLLAIGKAINGDYRRGSRPPGADLFAQSMKAVPHLALSRADPLETIEILCCAALYLQCLDKRQAAYNLVGQALRIALFEGMHTDMRNRHCSDAVKERCRAIWWTVYVLDCHLSAIIGVPQSLSAHDVSAELPHLNGSAQDPLALNLHVKLAMSTSSILKTVYSKDGQTPGRFLDSIKISLRNLAIINDLRVASFPIQLRGPSCGIPRTSAYLQLFHNQCIILATRPLLFCFWQHRLAMTSPTRVSSSGGARSLVRICAGAAQQSLQLLAALQAQSLLDSFLFFDLESTWSAAVLVSVANAVDPTLLGGCSESLKIAHSLLDEMSSRGNLVAASYKVELALLERHLEKLNCDVNYHPRAEDLSNFAGIGSHNSAMYTTDDETMNEWLFENGISGEQLIEVADSLNLDGLDWLTSGSLNGMDATFL